MWIIVFTLVDFEVFWRCRAFDELLDFDHDQLRRRHKREAIENKKKLRSLNISGYEIIGANSTALK